MPYQAKRGFKRFQRKFKRRYASKKKATASSVAKLYRRVNNMQRNQEVKFITTKINPGNLNISNATPFLQALDLPNQGLTSQDRVGYKINFVHQSGKMRFLKMNWGDTDASVQFKAYIIWLKNPLDIVTQPLAVGDILNPDYNGQLSVTSYFNKASYGNWIATYKCGGSIRDLTPISTWAGTPQNPESRNTLQRLPQNTSMYKTFNRKINVPAEWQTTESNQYPPGTNAPQTRHKPYLMIVCDANTTTEPGGLLPGNVTGTARDTFTVRGEIRLSYKDA